MHLSVRGKLLASFATVLLLSVVIGVLALVHLGTVSDQVGELARRVVPATENMGEATTITNNRYIGKTISSTSIDPRNDDGYASVNGSPPQIMNAASRNSSANPIVIIIWGSGFPANRRRNSRSIAKPTALTMAMAASAAMKRLCVCLITV